MAITKSNVLLVGGGGVGTIAALNLELSGRTNVTVVLRSNYQRVVDFGFDITSVDHGTIKGWKPSRVISKMPTASEGPFDYVVCTTKNTPDCSPTLVEAFPENIVLSGVSMIGSTEMPHGVIAHLDPDELLVGAFHNPALIKDKQEAAAKHFIELYSGGGKTECTFVPDVPFSRWRKLVYNACLNSTCAITGLDTGRLRIAKTPIVSLVRPAMEEIRLAANASDVRLPDDVADKMMSILESVEDYFAPSMLVDVRKGNSTEFENIVGGPLREGTKNGVDMPTLRTLYALLQAIQRRLMEAKGLVGVA